MIVLGCGKSALTLEELEVLGVCEELAIKMGEEERNKEDCMGGISIFIKETNECCFNLTSRSKVFKSSTSQSEWLLFKCPIQNTRFRMPF
jgi:hypothetical protein